MNPALDSESKSTHVLRRMRISLQAHPIDINSLSLLKTQKIDTCKIKEYPCQSGGHAVVHSIADVLIFGFPACMITNQGHILYESAIYKDFPQSLRSYISKQSLDPSVAIELEGEYCNLCGLWDDQFWHWMMEYLPKVILAEAAGFTGTYIVPMLDGFIVESLEMLGISQNRLLEYHGNPLHCQTLYIPQSIDAHNQLQLFPDLVRELRERLLSACEVPNRSEAAKRIYIARTRADRPRRVVNEKELVETLDKFNFQTVYMEKYPLKEQIGIASQARVLVGPHGAGTLHQLFMPPESLVIELFSPFYVLTNNVAALNLLRHRYYSIVGQNGDVFRYPAGLDIRANLMLLEPTLRLELEREGRYLASPG